MHQLDKIKSKIKLFLKIFIKKKNDYEINEDVTDFVSFNKYLFPKESIVVGNGPSLDKFIDCQLNFFKNKSIFCVNDFSQSKYYEILKPNFYVFADPAYWDRDSNPSIIENIKKTFSDIKNKTAWNIVLFFPMETKDFNYALNLPEHNSNIKILYYNNCNYDLLKNRFNLYQQNKAIVRTQTVVIAALFLSLNFGFKINYLVGADMSLHKNLYVNKLNVVYNKSPHFKDLDDAKFTPFWRDSQCNETFKMSELMQAFYFMFSGFEELEEYSKYLNSKIYNLNEDSFIDSFEKLIL